MKRAPFLLLPLLAAGSAGAHLLSPALLQVNETARGQYEVLWKSGLAESAPGALEPVFPARCTPGERAVQLDPASAASWLHRFHLDCGGRSLSGEAISVAGRFDLHPEAVLTFRAQDGEVSWAVLREGARTFTIEGDAALAPSVRAAVAAGLAGSFEPLCFVFGLFLLLQGGRRLLETTAAFAAAQAAATALAAIGLVHLPAAPASAAMAAALVLLAASVARRSAWERPWSAGAVCGLLQGFALAPAMPRAHLAAALPAFAAAAALLPLLSAAALPPLAARLPAPGRLARLVPAAMGSLAAWACIARVARFWTEGQP